MPAALVRALAPLQSQALVAWREARQEKRFERFAPYLEKLVALRREMADALGVPHGGERYDALLEGFEEGMRVSRLDPIFQNLAGWLVPLAERFTPPRRPLLPLTICTDEERPLSSIFSTLHEAGHGLYEQGLPELHRRHVLCAAPSMGLHESQSRLWENLVGRSLIRIDAEGVLQDIHWAWGEFGYFPTYTLMISPG